MHWKHSKFEIAHIILGNCHTFDEAYRVLRELEEDRSFAIQSALAESKRAQSKVVTAKLMLSDPKETKAGKLLAECNVEEQAARSIVAQPCLDEARRELDFIRLLIEKVEPHRAFREYPDHVAHQLSQEMEWRFDLHWKTYNYLCSSGSVPHDHMMLLRMHPAASVLLQGLRNLCDVLSDSQQANSLMFYTKKEILSKVAEDRTHFLFDANMFYTEKLIKKHSTKFEPKSLSHREEFEDEV